MPFSITNNSSAHPPAGIKTPPETGSPLQAVLQSVLNVSTAIRSVPEPMRGHLSSQHPLAGTHQGADLPPVVGGVNNHELPPAIARMLYEGGAGPDDFKPVVLPERFGASTLAGQDVASRAYKELVKRGFFERHPEIQTWNNVASFLNERRDAIAEALGRGVCPEGVTRTEDYQCLHYLLQSAKNRSQQLFSMGIAGYSPEQFENLKENTKLFERLAEKALALWESEAVLIEHHKDPDLARSSSANTPVSLLSDAPEAYTPV